jgi:hypothetical protein
MHNDRCGNTREQKCHSKGTRKEKKYKSLSIEIQRIWNMKYYDHTGNNWSQRNSNKIPIFTAKEFLNSMRRWGKFNQYCLGLC